MEKIDDSLNNNFNTNRSFIPFQFNKEKEKGRNYNDIFDKDIYYSKTESNHELNKNTNMIKMNKDRNKSDYFNSFQKIQKMKMSNYNNNDNKSKNNNVYAKNLKLSELTKYMNNAHNINIYSNRTKNNDIIPRHVSLNNYFEVNKINQGKKSMNNIYNNINVYNKSFIDRKNSSNFIYKKNNKIYSETERYIVKNNNNNITIKNSDTEKKEKTLLKLEKILQELKLNQNDIQNELISITKQNSELENKKNMKTQKIYNNIKNILNNIHNQDSKNIININPQLYNELSLKEKCKMLRKIYIEEKLQKSLIEKINALYINSYSTINDGDINAGNDYNLINLINWIKSLGENIDYLQMQNDQIKFEINEKIKEKENYKIYYNKWLNIFDAHSKKEIIGKINELIKEQNFNNNEKNKMMKMLFNKKNS